LFTDEAMFTRDGIFNFNNVRIWARPNPHAIREARHQNTFSVNIWAVIVGDRLICPVRLIIIILTVTGLSPGGSGYFTRAQIEKKVTRKFKSGGLHERHVVATWKLGNHLSIRL